jgi:nucleoside-diphosphate-sugar epimerase
MEKDNKIVSVYGPTGFIGSRWMDMYPSSVSIPREQDDPHDESSDVLYMISTTDNYNIFDKPYEDIETNLTKLIKVLESCKGKDITFNFVSSWFVYGSGSSLDTKESSSCNPTGFYSITKRAAEQMLICYCETFGMNYRIFRMTNVIGEGDKGVSLKKNALQYMMGLLNKNEPIKLYDDGSNIRDFMYVDDACRAIKTCIDLAPLNEIINITNREPISIGEAIRYSKKKLGSSSELISIEAPYFHKIVQVKNVCLNNDKITSYGYLPSVHTFEAIDKILTSIEGA